MPFCPSCGTQAAESGATFCANCGTALTTPPAGVAPPSAPWQAPRPTTIPNYLVPAILTTVFCCLPAGIVAIVFAAQVNSKERVGDIAGAMAASKSAKIWSIVSASAALAIGLLWLVFFAITTASSHG